MRKKRTEPSMLLFKQLKLLRLPDVIKLNILAFVYKSLNDLIPSPIHYESRYMGPYALRHAQALVVPFSRSSQYQRFLEVRGAKLWNELTSDIRTSRTIYTFKKRLKNIYLDTYQ